ALLGSLVEMDMVVHHLHVPIGRRDIDVSGLDSLPVAAVGRRQSSPPAEERGQVAMGVGRDMENNEQGGRQTGGEVGSDLAQRSDAAGGCAEDGEVLPSGRGRGLLSPL